ncbi:hypothetical protein FE391_43830 [Nonomuraea sp. KC401]|uniref:hypothetical protein n=1 Tax=Nonomuraea sp. KC401 TaxID=1848324 RepID=UPI0010FF156E|nr:hypothetical protein [Nonomuraea sp. KC401]TLF52171.1 hypothetical protein FE391_43830 [Nonomuraea sp. KC401]
MPTDQVGEVTGQRPQFFQDLLVELVRGDVGLDLGQPLALRRLGLAIGPAVSGAGSGTVLAVVPGERPAFARATVTTVPVTAFTPLAITAAATRATIVPVAERAAAVILTTRTTVESPLTTGTTAVLLTTGTVTTFPPRTAIIPIPERTAAIVITTRTPIIPIPERTPLTTPEPTIITLTTRTTIVTTLTPRTTITVTTRTVTALTPLTGATLTARAAVVSVPVGTAIVAFTARTAGLTVALVPSRSSVSSVAGARPVVGTERTVACGVAPARAVAAAPAASAGGPVFVVFAAALSAVRSVISVHFWSIRWLTRRTHNNGLPGLVAARPRA